MTDIDTAVPDAPEAHEDAAPEPQVDDLPEWARESLKKANAEAAAYRKKVRDLEPLAKRAKQLEDASKSDIERATEALSAAEKRAQEAEVRALRLEVAAEKGLTPAQARRLVGGTKEELESDADDLLASFPSSTPDAAPRKPQERLRPGSLPSGDQPEETDPAKLARAARARSQYA